AGQQAGAAVTVLDQDLDRLTHERLGEGEPQALGQRDQLPRSLLLLPRRHVVGPVGGPGAGAWAVGEDVDLAECGPLADADRLLKLEASFAGEADDHIR